LEKDFQFASDVISERSKLLDTSWKHASQIVIPNLQTHSQDRTLLRMVWVVELLWMGLINMAMVYELTVYCAMSESLMPTCRHCGTSNFIVWLAPLSILWFLNLYTYALLVSRGAHFSLTNWRSLNKELDDDPIPGNAVRFFQTMSIVLACWIVVGFGPLMDSNRCNRGLHRQRTPGSEVSPMMWWGAALTMVLYFPLFYFGRR